MCLNKFSRCFLNITICFDSVAIESSNVFEALIPGSEVGNEEQQEVNGLPAIMDAWYNTVKDDKNPLVRWEGIVRDKSCCVRGRVHEGGNNASLVLRFVILPC
jgi:hypothetical protein